MSGNATLRGPVDDVWTKLRDPQVLVRTIPGCQRLETTGEDEYRMTVTAGVASIKGTYLGTVRLTDPQPPNSFVLRANGAGNPGTVDASVTVSLAGDEDGTTRLEYDAEAVVGGTIAGVGQRMLSSAAKRTAGEFFNNVDAVLSGAEAAAPAATAAEGDELAPAAPSSVAAPGARAAEPGTFEAPQQAVQPAASRSTADFVKGAAFGAVIALAGAAVGGLLGRNAAQKS